MGSFRGGDIQQQRGCSKVMDLLLKQVHQKPKEGKNEFSKEEERELKRLTTKLWQKQKSSKKPSTVRTRRRRKQRLSRNQFKGGQLWLTQQECSEIVRALTPKLLVGLSD